MADNATSKKEGIAAELKEQFGQVSQVEKDDGKATVRSFSSDNVYVGLKVQDKFNEVTGKMEEVPKLTTKVGADYINLPMKGAWWKEFAKFAAEMAIILEGVDIENIRMTGDVELGRDIMSKYRTKPQ